MKSGYLIEDGKLTQPVKDINIIGNGPKALADITMVANNDKIDNGTWTCGKDGQSCPVTCGMPSALVSKLTVGEEKVNYQLSIKDMITDDNKKLAQWAMEYA